MQSFSIRDMENLSGIKAHTLRIWEQRYNLIMPARKKSRHRVYTNDDLKQILRISFLYHQGHRISKIAQMSADEVNRQNLEHSRGLSNALYINQFIEAALEMDEPAFEMVFEQIFTHLGFDQAMIYIVYPYLEKLGMLWMTGNLLPAQEHFSSQLIRKQILLDTDKITLKPVEHAEKILVFAPKGEFHEIPLLLIANFLKKAGYQVIYFGTNIHLETLIEFGSMQPFDSLYVHLLTNFMDQSIDQFILQLSITFPGRKIYLSGPVCKPMKCTIPGLQILRSMQDIRSLQPHVLK